MYVSHDMSLEYVTMYLAYVTVSHDMSLEYVTMYLAYVIVPVF